MRYNILEVRKALSDTTLIPGDRRDTAFSTIIKPTSQAEIMYSQTARREAALVDLFSKLRSKLQADGP
jgi:hypothetical protein